MLSSQLEILSQGKLYLNTVSESDYTAIISPNFISSAGSHMRHIIDHYLAIISGSENGLIDYDVRLRGNKIELSPQLAIEKLNEIADKILNFSANELNKIIPLSSEVSVTNKNIQTVKTSIARELMFAGSHAVHHYAMIAQITFAQKASLPECFGIAPATATFLREQNKIKKNIICQSL